MKIKTLKFSACEPGDKPEPVRSELEIEKPHDLEKAKEQTLPVAYFFRLENLAGLREFKDLIVDRGTKHPSKPLAKLLLGYDKIPLINSEYSASGSSKKSVRKLLDNALDEGDRNLYLIGVEDDIFSELWEKAGEVKKEKALKERARNGKYRPYEAEGTDISSWFLHELRQQCTVPKKLAERYVGKSEDADLVRHLIILAAKSETPVLILGDTGTGKEVIAREIHRYSDRNGLRFTPVNCGGIPHNLLESELFGHVRGAFTSAISDKKGLWEVAGEGTLFLDEIGDLHAKHQPKILRALEEQEIIPVGATKYIPVSARVIAATNRDLFSMVQAKEFSDALYYRLQGFLVRTPTLRNHPEDIPELAQFFWKKITKDNSKTLTDKIRDELKLYSWPGNARELKMILNNLHALFGTNNLRVEHLKSVFYLEGQRSATVEAPVFEKTVTLHRAECIRHLKRVQEVVYTTQFNLNSAIGRLNTKLNIASVLTSLKFNFHELEILCRQPSLFHSDPSFSAVWRLLERLTRFQERLQKDVKEAKEYWKYEFSAEFQLVQSTLFKEVERILDKV